MIKNKFLLVFSLVIFSCSSEFTSSNYLKDLNIHGNVKSIEENTYEAFENENKIEKGDKVLG